MIQQEFKEYFLELIDYHYIKIINFGRIYLYNRDGYYLLYNYQNKNIWLSDTTICTKLEHKFGYNYEKIEILIKDILEECFKLNIFTVTINKFVQVEAIEKLLKLN